MAKVETMDVLVAMAKAILEIAGETAEATPAKAEKPAKTEKVKVEKKAAPADAEDAEDDGLEGKTTKELYQMCVDAGIKVPKYGKNKAFYIAALQGDAAEDTDGDEADDDAEDDPYAGKTAKELFELCKKRSIKAAPKKKAEVYIELLKKADAAEAEADDDDDWDDDDEVEEEAPKKQTKQKAKAKAKKPAEPEEDEDDDWDI